MVVKAILFDTRSIQRYIFSGNKLKTNIGASFIVERLFQDVLVDDVLEEHFGDGLDARNWESKDIMFDSLAKECQVAYIGGGNALILFQENTAETVLKDIVGDFTKLLLIKYPGLHTGAAIGKLDLSSLVAYKESNQKLHDDLQYNQNTIFPQVNVPYTGLTLACEVNGETANYFDQEGLVDKQKPRFFSQEVAAKAGMAEKANAKLRDDFAGVVGDFAFPAELDKLGQKPTENYLAVVHIDGNNMGRKFSACKNLQERIALSRSVSKKTKSSFAALLEEIVGEYPEYQKWLELGKNREGRSYLPIRPLILGGDDITFICAGRVALSYAKRFMEKMMIPDKETKKELKNGMDCCAGIAILPTSYPFFRGYELAEQLCGEAKKESRKKEGSSWLDFAVLHGEQAPTIGQIREQEYSGAFIKKLHFGPYEIGGNGPKTVQNLLDTIEAVQQAIQEKHLAMNKVKELRYTLQRSEHDIKNSVEQMKHMGKMMPVCEAWDEYEEKLWAESEGERKSPYVDVIEMLDFTCQGGDKNGEE